MGEQIVDTGNELKGRWTQRMPRFFRQLLTLCVCVAATALGVNTAMVMSGAVPHEWWTDIYPLLIGVPTGMAIVCKLTVAGGYKDLDPGKLTQGNPLLGDNDRPPHDEYGHDPHHRPRHTTAHRHSTEGEEAECEEAEEEETDCFHS